MKTTVDLPKALYRSLRSRSRRERRSIEAVLADLIRSALGQTARNSPRLAKSDDHHQWREELLE